jgi:hypothetical protein
LIQGSASDWGFFVQCESPIGDSVPCSDSNGANVSRVPDPAGGGGYALRQYINPRESARSQLGIWGFAEPPIQNQLNNRGEIWIQMEVYIPSPAPSNSGNIGWLSIMDTQSTGSNGAERWHTNPGVFLCSAVFPVCGSGSAGKLVTRNVGNNVFVGPTTNPVPLNQWFKLQVHFIWSTSPVPVTYYITGQQV